MKKRRPLFAALLSAVLGPGIGQFFNRDFAKGIFLIVVSLGGFFWFTFVVTEQMARFLLGPAESWNQDPEAVKTAMMKIFQENPSMFITFYVLMILVWIYGVIDAYISAKRKKIPLPSANENPDTLG